MRTISLKYCEVFYELNDLVYTRFRENGAEYGAHPHHEPHYYVISHRLGYGDDIWQYCFEHEVAHSFVAEKLRDAPSHVIWSLANREPIVHHEAIQEEVLAQLMQRYARANEEPIVSDVPWFRWKEEFLRLLD